MPPNRWTVDAPNGTAFHEIMVLPNLAPHLARPEHMGPFPRLSADVQGPDPQPADNETTPEPIPYHTAPERLFFISVTMNYTIPARGGARSMPKKSSETKSSTAVSVLSMSRCDFLRRVLQVHDLHQLFQPSDVSGFPVKISWPGSIGGKTNAPTIRDNSDFSTILDQLSRTKKAVNTLLVNFDMEYMEPFRSHSASAVIDPRLANFSPAGEMQNGPGIPRVDAYSDEAQLHGSIIVDIREEWKCEEHDGTCYRKDGSHYPANRWKLKSWAAAIVSINVSILTTPATPPPDLFTEDNARPSHSSKPSRGRNGPRPQSIDFSQLLGTILPGFVGAIQGSLQPPTTPHKRTRTSSTSPSPARQRQRLIPPSSPAPLAEDELRLCVNAFGKFKDIGQPVLDNIFDSLDSHGYTPDALEVVRIERIVELTHLAEGRAASFLKFAKGWSARVESKRAKAL
ncbi:hypothetical protein FIBSPDRAFT_1028306 [Athelia psychrophila]|uniref:Uncharacterized protein n=1 Tax=Athelia psychrophila TaxID=1759441 RepID=A0A166GUS7_9AGAM|nr:hypothetical protein FIBSPDRAFT_1028302 [Fibularhizoctonia sp. CBS 109695]KZP18187.1 hypothetical protein FIBSPDRAFT_1028306 [Fibularhizoctonia sp. CBS 109695]